LSRIANTSLDKGVELDALERDEQVTRWVELYKLRGERAVSNGGIKVSQLATPSGDRQPGLYELND
jgi:hypothetical protein